MFFLNLAIFFFALELLWRKGYAFWWAMIAFSIYLSGLHFWLFLLLAVFSSCCWHLYYYRKPRFYEAIAYNRNSSCYLGREFLLTRPMRAGMSAIEFDDMIWPVYSIGDDDLPMGTWMKVKRTDGVILMAMPIK